MEQSFPLDFLLERGAIVANRVNGEDIMSVMGATNQLWVPGLPAKYFVRDIRDMDVVDEVYRAFFTTYLPARTVMAVAALPMDALVQIDAIFGNAEGTPPIK